MAGTEAAFWDVTPGNPVPAWGLEMWAVGCGLWVALCVTEHPWGNLPNIPFSPGGAAGGRVGR